MNRIIFILILLFGKPVMAEFNLVKLKTSDQIELNAKLFQPSILKEKNAAALIIEGSGKPGFSEEPPKSPFIQLADELAKKGLIVLKFNKRGSGENLTNGSFWKSTFTIDNNDAQSALNFLKAQKGVDPDNIFLIGHSFGGPHSLVLSQKNKIAGVVLLTSTIQPVELLMHDQNKVIMELRGLSDKEIQSALADLDKQLREIKIGAYKCVEPGCTVIDGIPVLDKSIQIPWLNEVLNLNFLNIAMKQPSPVLFIFGNSDFVIPASEQVFVKKQINKETRPKIEFKIIEKLDHFMVENNSKKESLQYAHKAKAEKLFKNISKELVNTISAWIVKK